MHCWNVCPLGKLFWAGNLSPSPQPQPMSQFVKQDWKAGEGRMRWNISGCSGPLDKPATWGSHFMHETSKVSHHFHQSPLLPAKHRINPTGLMDSIFKILCLKFLGFWGGFFFFHFKCICRNNYLMISWRGFQKTVIYCKYVVAILPFNTNFRMYETNESSELSVKRKTCLYGHAKINPGDWIPEQAVSSWFTTEVTQKCLRKSDRKMMYLIFILNRKEFIW